MRLDHIAYRVKDREATAAFFVEAFGFRRQTEFEITLEDGSTASCIALEPPEKRAGRPFVQFVGSFEQSPDAEYHVAPEIFVSSGPHGGLIDKWVESREEKMEEWMGKGWLFTMRGTP